MNRSIFQLTANPPKSNEPPQSGAIIVGFIKMSFLGFQKRVA
jgi:hypothetical protein